MIEKKNIRMSFCIDKNSIFNQWKKMTKTNKLLFI